MFCRECGKMVQDGNKFCTGCGTKVEPISMNKNVETETNQNSGPIVEENKKINNSVNNINTNTANNNNYSSNGYYNANNNYSNTSFNNSSYYVPNKKDKYSVGFNILSFFVPLVGLVLFLIWKEETPKKAKGIGISALVGYILSIIVPIIFAIIMFVMAYSSEVIIEDYDDNWLNDDYYYEDYDFNYKYKPNGKYNI